jgi:hypothetical protein
MNTLVTLMLLSPQREYVCFNEVRKIKAWNYNPLFSSVLHFASAQGSMHQMMGGGVLVDKFPLPMLSDFFWLMALQRA